MNLLEWTGFYLKECSQRKESRLKSEEAKIEGYLLKIKLIDQNSDISGDIKANEINKSNRDIRNIKSLIVSIRNKNITEEYITEFLNTHKQIESYRVDSDGTLNIFTKMLRDGSDFIGKFRIAIRPDFVYRVYNLTYWGANYDTDDYYDEEDEEGDSDINSRKLEYAHWAVHYGQPCLGAYNDLTWDSYYSGDLKMFFENVIFHLIMSGDDNAYCSRETWLENEKIPKKISAYLSESDIYSVQKFLGSNSVPETYKEIRNEKETPSSGNIIPDPVAAFEFEPF